MASLPTNDIKTQANIYQNFRGVDFFNEIVQSYRSPDSVNMWKNYNSSSKGIETRPGMTKLGTLGLEIFGLFFYNINNTTQVLVHYGTKLAKWNNFPETPNLTEIYTKMNVRKSESFIFNNILYIKDGINYLEYNGTDLKEVEGTIPVTTTLTKPNGGGERLNSYNLIQPKRTNEFIGDGESLEYYVDAQELDDTPVVAVVNGTTLLEDVGFKVDREAGKITFNTAPAKANEQENNVSITFAKTISGDKEKILKSTLSAIFDNRIFVSGNQDYPNALFWSELEDPRYFGSDNWTPEGDMTFVRALVKGYNELLVIKEPNQEGTSVISHTPTLDYDVGKVYPAVESNINEGCISTGINFRDSVVFLSKNGLESITGEITQERLLTHVSTMVDNKMINNIKYKDAQMVEYKGYLLILIDSKVFLADSRATFQDTNLEYEWFYWELPFDITYLKENNENLYLGNENGDIYILDGNTDNGTNITSKWSTPMDSFGYEAYRKTTNKSGAILEVEPKGSNIKVEVKKDMEEPIEIGSFSDEKGYIVLKIKQKKWRELQMIFSSNTPFSIVKATIEVFIGGYIKR